MIKGDAVMVDPLQYLLDTYFAPWEIERAVKLRDSEGLPAAVEYLRKNIVTGCQGYSGPTSPRVDTRPPLVNFWPVDADKWTRPAPFSITCEKLAVAKLRSLVQPRLF